MPRVRPLLLAPVLLAGCPKQDTAVTPPEPPPIQEPESVSLESEEDYRAQQATAQECMEWLLEAHPAAKPQTWTVVRDFALDWIEGAPYVDAKVNPNVLAKIEGDRHFIYSVYMRAAYLSARTLHALEDPESTQLQREVAAIRGMQRLYAVFREADPDARCKRLDKFASLDERGKLEPYVAALLD